MAVVASISQGWQLFKESFRVLRKHPALTLPLFFSWIIIAVVTLLFRYYEVSLSLAFLAVFLVAYSLCLACLLLLELIQQIEMGRQPSLVRASAELVSKDAIKVIPIAFVWAIIWFIILILRALSRKDREGKAEPSLADAGRTLSGMNTPFSWIGLGLDLFEKLVRMTVFSLLPAIAWENLGPWQASKKGSRVVRLHPIQFLTNFGLTAAAALIMAIPLIPIAILDEAGVQFSSLVWVGIIIYAGIIWTIEIYLEQMTIALLYLWHLKWEKNGSRGDLSSVPQPHLLDEIPDLYPITYSSPPSTASTLQNP